MTIPARFLAVVLWGSAVTLPVGATAGETPASSTETPKTVITGGRMNILEKGDAVEFSQGVQMTRGRDYMTADRVVYEEKQGRVRAWRGDDESKRVYLRRDVQEENLRWEAWADEAVYDTAIGSGTLIGRTQLVKVRRTFLKPAPGAGVFEMESQTLMFLQKSTVAAASAPLPVAVSTAIGPGSVRASGSVFVKFLDTVPEPRDTRVWAKDAAYDDLRGAIRFTGTYDEFPMKDPPPKKRKDVGARARQVTATAKRDLSGKSITYHIRDQRLIVEKNVKAKTESMGKKK
ncbi:MAG TPA: LptA/OstA family protein [Elusimicrobiota bacterium]|nr:LptA/OstA family protein [Elusimicrobiota bacterium]